MARSRHASRFSDFRLTNPQNSIDIGGLTTKFDGLVTARLRTGLALDNLLLFVTGGAAFVHTKTSYTIINTEDPGENAAASVNAWRWGWTAGFGTEWAWTDRISIKSEVLYVGVTSRDYARLDSNGNNRFFTESDSIWISRIGLNYRWGGAR